MKNDTKSDHAGILLLDKPKGDTSFSLVYKLRKLLGVQKIGHAGTLDPFATGVMVMLVGKAYTKLSNQFLGQDKEYEAKIHLGISTDTYDCDGKITVESQTKPSLLQIENALLDFQGEIEQIPPMYSAKKVKGKKLYELARQGIEIPRAPVKVTIRTQLLDYAYPFLHLRIQCSKGTYIRSLANDLGIKLHTGAHLAELVRTRSGPFFLQDCISINQVDNSRLKAYAHH